MPLINLARVINNPMFTQSFTVLRSTNGAFNTEGKFVDGQTTIAFNGIVQPATAKEVALLPEGDRQKEVKSFHSTQEFFVANVANQASNSGPITPQNSDIAVW